jgi:peroxiredoxin Q/BCP
MIQIFALLVATAFAGIAPGTQAPEIVAKNQDGKEVKLADFKGKWILLYFYPKDDTPGCTKQACQLRDEHKEFQKAGVQIFGVSRQGMKSHQEFKKKYKLPFDLLADEDGKLGEAFDVGSMPIIGIYKRQTVLIGPDFKVKRFMEDVDPATHSREILKTVRSG